ncbi:MAG: RNA polymerase factor sigma-54 [Lentisphaerae bacterium]|nr:RNA polymerase factor sigma-54 [Lentisphaerota bacterium]MBT4817296.1 RNA polymerase factor sigma-54 [Lentisphaerota bacterium]MBT5607729.1 RNA polymerase factor sigma-54 [Lentisphaerota bacterium]MBT7054892.1 RNA polymerase factor sigma-54 [Lentisphaerota bacterium]MBT7843338.1 RNA polymerase factor sigma-54 [Lentisphaerota bacterium]
MAPQQIQALEILLATIPELEQKISSELAENPTLELMESGSERLVGNPIEDNQGPSSPNDEAAAKAAETDEAVATLIQLGEIWRDYAPPKQYSGQGSSDEDQERRQFLFDSLIDEPGLQDVLQNQLRQADGLSEKAVKIAEQIIGSIDESGYLRTHISDIAITSDADLSEVKKMVNLVQSFEPAGIGARDLRECLMLQLDRNGEKGSLAYQVVDQHLEAVGRNQIPKVARALHTSSTQLYQALEDIRGLNPYPGSQVTPSPREDFVYPEVFIERDEEGNWVVRLNRDYSPRLRISPYYLKILEDPNYPRDAKSYIREKIGSSKLLLRAIDQRQSTIEQIAHSLLKFQNPFFEQGVSAMRPLVMNDVAEDIGVHETTVSRAIANKYVQTTHGLFPFRHFFSTGYTKDDGQELSSHSIKQRLQEYVNEEDTKKPLSDQKLAEMLKEDGLKVARRTVAKYREELDILPSHMRRNY